MLNEVRPLGDVVRADTKSVIVRLRAEKTAAGAMASMHGVLRSAPGECPVTLHVALPDGAEAVLSLPRELRVEVGDLLLAGLERIFGEQVAELR